MRKHIIYILVFLVIISSLLLVACEDDSYTDSENKSFLVSEILDYDEFLSRLIKVDGVTVNFKNFLHKLSKDENSQFKIISSTIKVSNNYNPTLSFYCLVDNETEIPKRIIYTHIDGKDNRKSKLFHGQIFQELDSNGNIKYIVNGDFYDESKRVFFRKNKNFQNKINVFNKGRSDRILTDKKEIPIHKPGLNLNTNLINTENDFSLSLGEESILNFHILGNPKHYEKVYDKKTLNFN